MAINFEAANMAGYNNPKIEVFKAVLDGKTSTFTAAPPRPDIISCIQRGSIPVILMTAAGYDAGYVFWLFGCGTSGPDSIVFCAGGDAVGVSHRIEYVQGRDTPIYSTATK